MLTSGILIGLAIGIVVGVPIAAFEIRRQTRRARAAERRARDAQRMAEIGAMTGGLAHEIKNPLSTIGLNLQLLAESFRDLEIPETERSRLIRRADIIRREVDRLKDILTDFLKFAGTIRLETRRTDLNALVEELVDFYVPQAQNQSINLRTSLAPGPAWALLDPAQFKQAVLNLMINATHAMEHKNLDAQAPRELMLKTEPDSDARAKSWILHVIDTGTGIPPENIEKIFTPYFTTKSGGSGLGLPTARRIIEEHGGELAVHSEPGMGSDFSIRVPRTD